MRLNARLVFSSRADGPAPDQRRGPPGAEERDLDRRSDAFRAQIMSLFDFSRVVPAGFCIDAAIEDGDAVVVMVRALAASGMCSVCGSPGTAVHSLCERELNDLPIGGRRVRLVTRVGHFRCDVASCPAGYSRSALMASSRRWLAGRTGLAKSFPVSPSRSAVDRPPLSPDGSASLSATTSCFEWCVDADRQRCRRHR